MFSTEERKPDFWIKNIPVFGKTILAPMDGLSDYPTRMICRRYGSALSYTEFLNTIDILHRNRSIDRRMYYSEGERPVVFQLLDSDPDRLVAATEAVLSLHPDIIDINLGCPSRNISARGAGAGLMRYPALVGRIFKTLTDRLNIPVTAKIRLGWDEQTMNYLEIAHIIEDNGGALIAVHGRTRSQVYTGTADWEPIGRVKQAVSIPVVANGDIRTPADIQQAFQVTGCDAVMIGRAALGNPWIFSLKDIRDIGLAETILAIKEHLQLMVEFYGEQFGVVFFRKHIKAYLKRFHFPRAVMLELMTVPEQDQVLILLDQLQEDILLSEEPQ
jgi:tRNA-dihydrouridine synthase B